MFRRGALLLLATIAATAYRSRSTGSPQPIPEPLPTATATTTATPRPPDPGASAAVPRTLIVGGEHGLREVRREGTVVRVLSKTPARRPRFLPRGKDVLFYLRPAGEVRRLSLIVRRRGERRGRRSELRRKLGQARSTGPRPVVIFSGVSERTATTTTTTHSGGGGHVRAQS
jgi:hypothetical protein